MRSTSSTFFNPGRSADRVAQKKDKHRIRVTSRGLKFGNFGHTGSDDDNCAEEPQFGVVQAETVEAISELEHGIHEESSVGRIVERIPPQQLSVEAQHRVALFKTSAFNVSRSINRINSFKLPASRTWRPVGPAALRRRWASTG